MYKWYAVTDWRKICPTGWHVPTDAEWTILTTFLGGESVAGGKLKETGTTHWLEPNTGAPNETGFTALPGGYRSNDNGIFFGMGSFNHYWSSEMSDGYLWAAGVYYATPYFDIGYTSGAHGFSVRCLRDN